MISKFVRISTGAFVCAFMTMFLITISGLIPVDDALARDTETKPYVVPGDADGIGGYKGYEFVEEPSGVTGSAHGKVMPDLREKNILIYWTCSSPWLANLCIFVTP